jgi:hypothetical protein
MITPAYVRGAFVAFLCAALASPASAARHASGTPGRDGPGISIQLGHTRTNEGLKSFVFPSRKPSRTASPPADLPLFVNPLVRRRMAVTPTVAATPIEAADAR